MSVIRIKGRAKYLTLEGGFWGIESDDNYFPVNFPEQLKSEGRIVSCTIREIDIMTVQQWGIPCKIVGFATIAE